MSAGKRDRKNTTENAPGRTSVQAPGRGRSLAWLNVLCLVLVIIALLLAVRLITNRQFLKEYEQGEFGFETEERLLDLNIPERYLPYYNLGNAAYKRGNYKEAVMRYEEALARHPGLYSEEKDCRVRINLALAMLKQLDLTDLSSEDNVKHVVNVLLSARDILTENGCANPQAGVYDGHSEEAEQLKKEIDELLQKLTDQQDQQDQNDEQEQDQKEQQDPKTESSREKEIRKKMEEQMRESAQEKADAQQAKNNREDEENGSGGGNTGSNW